MHPRKIRSRTIPMVGVVAPSGTGKTTLLRKLVPLLRERGLRVGYLKHTHHGYQLDTPGKDSHLLAEAGAAQVMLAAAGGWALMDYQPAAETDLADADLARFAARFDAERLDLLLVEGFHRSRYPKIELYRATGGKAPIYPQDPDIIAVVTDTPLPDGEHPPELPLADPARIADFICARVADQRLLPTAPGDLLLAFCRRRRGTLAGSPILSASVRVGPSYWIASAGVGEQLRGADASAGLVDAEALPAACPREADVHRRVYREQPDARAVLHAHGPYAVAVGFSGRDFEPIDFEGMQGLGGVPVVTVAAAEQPDKFAAAIGEALAGFPMCLVAGHGSWTWAADLEAAKQRIELLERSAKIYVIARQAAAV